MGSHLYIGGLPSLATESQVYDLFAVHGALASLCIIKDRVTGLSRRFGFVEMTTAAEAQAAIVALHGTRLAGRTLTVKRHPRL
jgi:RNA recognition motif-containing protein